MKNNKHLVVEEPLLGVDLKHYLRFLSLLSAWEVCVLFAMVVVFLPENVWMCGCGITWNLQQFGVASRFSNQHAIITF